jgi:hypothetical protein
MVNALGMWLPPQLAHQVLSRERLRLGLGDPLSKSQKVLPGTLTSLGLDLVRRGKGNDNGYGLTPVCDDVPYSVFFHVLQDFGRVRFQMAETNARHTTLLGLK